jgi:acetyl esterase/lipase
MPVGYLITVGIVVGGILLALVPLGRSGRLGKLSWFLSAIPNESPFVAFYWVLAATLLALPQGDLDTPAAWAGLGLVCLSFVAAPVLIRRSLQARPALEDALDTDLDAGRRSRLEGTEAAAWPLPWARILFAPLPFFQWNVKRIANLSYGDAGRHNRLDIYRRRSGAQGGPILIHLHAGYFVTGRKSFESRPLLQRLASRGWVCISANYRRLRPPAIFRDLVIDVKKVIAWARAHADDYGADPRFVFVAGSSAGAHLAATAALSANDPTFQPGFEDADTTVTAAVGLYGYYGSVDSAEAAIPSAPGDYAHPQAPPVLIAHGGQDTFVPPEHARDFAERLRKTSENPVVYAELPGAQHSFDLVHSIRFHTLIDGIEIFAAGVRSPRSAP